MTIHLVFRGIVTDLHEEVPNKKKEHDQTQNISFDEVLSCCGARQDLERAQIIHVARRVSNTGRRLTCKQLPRATIRTSFCGYTSYFRGSFPARASTPHPSPPSNAHAIKRAQQEGVTQAMHAVLVCVSVEEFYNARHKKNNMRSRFEVPTRGSCHKSATKPPPGRRIQHTTEPNGA